MKKIEGTKQELLPDYNFDYSKTKTNRFTTQKPLITVTLDADIAEVFTNSDAVNKALRAILLALPNSRFHEKT